MRIYAALLCGLIILTIDLKAESLERKVKCRGDFTYSGDVLRSLLGEPCNIIKGNLRIALDSEQTDLKNMSAVEKIDGFLWIRSQNKLQSLEGLSNLKEVGGSLSIVDNASLSSLSSLSSLTRVGALRVGGNDSLLNLKGLEFLQTVEDYLYIVNSRFQSLAALSEVKSIGGTLELSNNRDMEEIFSKPTLERIGGAVHIYKNQNLRELSGMSSLEKIGKYLWVGKNPELKNLFGLSKLRSVTQYVVLSGMKLDSKSCPTGSLISSKLRSACRKL